MTVFVAFIAALNMKQSIQWPSGDKIHFDSLFVDAAAGREYSTRYNSMLNIGQNAIGRRCERCCIDDRSIGYLSKKNYSNNKSKDNSFSLLISSEAIFLSSVLKFPMNVTVLEIY